MFHFSCFQPVSFRWESYQVFHFSCFQPVSFRWESYQIGVSLQLLIACVLQVELEILSDRCFTSAAYSLCPSGGNPISSQSLFRLFDRHQTTHFSCTVCILVETLLVNLVMFSCYIWNQSHVDNFLCGSVFVSFFVGMGMVQVQRHGSTAVTHFSCLLSCALAN